MKEKEKLEIELLKERIKYYKRINSFGHRLGLY